jgi:hypothetical protein
MKCRRASRRVAPAARRPRPVTMRPVRPRPVVGRSGCVRLGLTAGAVLDGEPDTLADAPVWDGDADGDFEGECDGDGDFEGECDGDGDGECDGDGDGECDGDGDGECDGDGDGDGECDGDGDIDGECDGDGDIDGECDGDGDIEGEWDGDGEPLAAQVCVRLKESRGPSTSASALTSVHPAGVAIHAFDVPWSSTIAPPSVGIVFVVSAIPSPLVSKCRVSDTNVVSLPGSTKTQTSWSGNGPPPKLGSQS